MDQLRLYFFIENPLEFGLNPFYDYFGNVAGEWTPRITVIDIVKNVPLFLAKCLKKSVEIVGFRLVN